MTLEQNQHLAPLGLHPMENGRLFRINGAAFWVVEANRRTYVQAAASGPGEAPGLKEARLGDRICYCPEGDVVFVLPTNRWEALKPVEVANG